MNARSAAPLQPREAAAQMLQAYRVESGAGMLAKIV